MSNSTKLSRSNQIHRWFAKKHAKNSSKNKIFWIKRTYHDDVVFEQTVKGRTLSNKERRDVYNRVSSFYRKGEKQGKTIGKINVDYMNTYYNPFE